MSPEAGIITFTQVLEFAGTFAFAISGIRMASGKKFDWFGAYVVGVATAIGGGTIRDILLGVTPFWMTTPSYLIFSAIALVWVILFEKTLNRLAQTFFLFDTLGLALFTVVGIEKSLMLGHPFWVAIIMGCITGAAGGVIRDIMINEIPLIFRKEIYAMACIAGGIVFWSLEMLNFPLVFTKSVCGVAVLATRILAVKYHLTLPILQSGKNR